jgi:hypothetical protein
LRKAIAERDEERRQHNENLASEYDARRRAERERNEAQAEVKRLQQVISTEADKWAEHHTDETKREYWRTWKRAALGEEAGRG